MLCKDAEELIKGYKLGTITADNFLLLIHHVKECPKCRAIFEDADSSRGKASSDNMIKSLLYKFSKLKEKIKIKQKENKIYTKKSFYLIITIFISALGVFGALSKQTFNSIYSIMTAFMLVSSILVFGMLFTTE